MKDWWPALAAPFPADDIEWRVAQAGESNGRVWARVLAYCTNRAIMERLDTVCGPENWCNQFERGPDGGIICGLSLRVSPDTPGSEWISKWDGAEKTAVEAVKGGLSGAMKRAAVQWGIGRYLYRLEEGWAECYTDLKRGAFRGKTKEGKRFSWDPPLLPAWALPKGTKPAEAKKADDTWPEESSAFLDWSNVLRGCTDSEQFFKAVDAIAITQALTGAERATLGHKMRAHAKKHGFKRPPKETHDQDPE